ncbi:argininosuccinate lyase, partial [bacterium]|nr:argininosuccinate lyase [bacterium]
MWKGRFSQDTSSLVQQFGESISYDWRLFPHDIAGSIAHARAQKTIGLLTDDEFSQIENGLKEILADIEAGKFEFKTSLEDIHMNIESELTRRIGAAGAKLHTARSRNDQVIAALRIFGKAQLLLLIQNSLELATILLNFADKHRNIP